MTSQNDLQSRLQAETFLDFLQDDVAQLVAQGTHLLIVETVNLTNTQGLDAILYDVSNLPVKITTVDEFKAYINEHDILPCELEVDRCTILRFADI